MRGGGSGCDRHVHGAVTALPEMVPRLSVLEDRNEGDASSALGRTGGSRC